MSYTGLGGCGGVHQCHYDDCYYRAAVPVLQRAKGRAEGEANNVENAITVSCFLGASVETNTGADFTGEILQQLIFLTKTLLCDSKCLCGTW
ncbi:hypothetical protein JTB14_035861 [Gonioctena quinquepunctata]|nr:hypothetical protein JTB14_035861 [Gonioctena quinquepunctata]